MARTTDELRAVADTIETQSDALTLIWLLKGRFDLVTSIWTLDDVPLSRIDGEETNGLTAAEREVVVNSWEWRRGIDDCQSQYGYEVLPTVERYPDGSFSVYATDETTYYFPDGTEKQVATTCRNCHEPLFWDRDALVDATGGDVCTANDYNMEWVHMPISGDAE
jgi:hypothetical protein